jgi:SAM-dependent methyltransferase
MSADSQTIAFYDRDAGAYARASIEHGVRPSLVAFEAALPRAARVLDLGCGGGQDGAWLRERGHDVTAIDAPAGLAAEARRRYGLEVRVATFSDLDDVAAFDGVWCGAALHHACAADLPDIVARIARAIRPFGRFATLMKCGQDRRDGLGRFYCAMSGDAARALFAGDEWDRVVVRESVGAGYDGVETAWLVIEAVRR